jgi:hypothetical protein
VTCASRGASVAVHEATPTGLSPAVTRESEADGVLSLTGRGPYGKATLVI